MSGLVRYTLTAEVVAAPRVNQRARNAEPRELFASWVDALAAAGFELVGEVSVRPHGLCSVCGASNCEEHGA